METLVKEGGMDQDSSTGLSLGLSIGTGTTIRERYHESASQRDFNGPPGELDLFSLAPVLQPSAKTSPGINGSVGGSERSAGKAKVGIKPVPLSRLSDANKFAAPCYNNEDAGTINVSSWNSTVDSNATNTVSGYAMFKRKRGATEELEYHGRVCSSEISDVEEEGFPKKSKLRLSREQCALLEESFLQNRAPEPKQKQALALQLNLRPRQVEVWFQNRRARKKLKQTEVDCEVLKRCNESLVEENRKLQREVDRLRAMKMSSPATLTMCPSCERVSAVDNSSHFTLAKARSMFMRGTFGP